MAAANMFAELLLSLRRRCIGYLYLNMVGGRCPLSLMSCWEWQILGVEAGLPHRHGYGERRRTRAGSGRVVWFIWVDVAPS